MRQVKGTILIPWVKAIRADKSGVYDRFLTPADKLVLSRLLLESTWYPFETYRNCLNAVSAVVGAGCDETVRQWGRMTAHDVMTSVYRAAIRKGDPKTAIEHFDIVFRNMMNFGTMRSELISDNEILTSIAEFEPDFEMFYQVSRGWIECFVELCVDKDVDSEFLAKSWRGDPFTKIRLFW